MKILHTADWHIGQFKGPVVDGVNLRSQDTVKCLEYMVQVAIEEKPDIVCVSGDIFHQEQVGPVRYSDEMITATNIITSLAHFSKYLNDNILPDCNIDRENCKIETGYAWDFKLTYTEEGEEEYEDLSTQEVNEFLANNGHDDTMIIGISIRPFMYPNTMFLTEKEAREHLERNYYHYSQDAHTYCMCAWRSPEVEKLWKILRETKWDCKDKELESHEEKYILHYCISLMQELVGYFEEWYRWVHGENAIEELSEEERFCYNISYFHIRLK